MGLGQSDAETMRMIYSDPNFKGIERPVRSGALPGHDPAVRLSPNSAISPNSGACRCGARSPARSRPASSRRKSLIDALTRFQNEQRSIDYVKLDAAQAGTIDPPSPETLAAYFDDHKTQFRAPEYRKISFVAITPEEIGKWTEVSDEDAKKVFEQRRDKLGTPEKREVSQIVFPNAEEALGRAQPHHLRNVVRRSRQGARPQSVRRRPRPDHEIRDHRSRDRGCGVLAAVRRGQPAGAGPFRRGAGQDRQDRARDRCRPMKASPRN